MDFLFVGTGAADYEACLACHCTNCVNARSLGGRNLRTYAAALVDGELLIDCAKTVPWRLAELDVDLGGLEGVLITHSHSDHLDPGALRDLLRAAGGGPTVYGNRRVIQVLGEAGLPATPVEPGDWFTVGASRVLALPARHDWEHEQALTYLIEGPDGCVLYATDTAWPPGEWWSLLGEARVTGAVIEATFGPLTADEHPDCLTHHLNWESFSELVRELRRRGILAEGAPAWATHLSLHWLPVHELCREQLALEGCEPAFDGLRLCLRAT